MKLIIALVAVFCVLNAYPVKIIDSSNREIIIKEKPKKIAIIGGMWPLPSLIIALQGHSNNLVYIPKASLSALQYSFLYNKEIDKIPNGNAENIEYLLSLKPDLFMCHIANIALCNDAKNTGINTIIISVKEWNYNSFETLKGWLKILAPILNEEEKSENIINYTKGVIEDIKNKVSKVELEKKPSIMIIHNQTSRELYVGGLFANYLLEATGAQNAFKEISSAKQVNIEEVYKKNPDIIYINNFSKLIPDDLLKESKIFESNLYKNIKAIKNKQVFKFPLPTYRPFAPGLDLPILMLFMAKHNHEDIFSDLDLKETARKYYKDILNFDLNDEQISKIFTPTRSVGQLK